MFRMRPLVTSRRCLRNAPPSRSSEPSAPITRAGMTRREDWNQLARHGACAPPGRLQTRFPGRSGQPGRMRATPPKPSAGTPNRRARAGQIQLFAGEIASQLRLDGLQGRIAPCTTAQRRRRPQMRQFRSPGRAVENSSRRRPCGRPGPAFAQAVDPSASRQSSVRARAAVSQRPKERPRIRWWIRTRVELHVDDRPPAAPRERQAIPRAAGRLETFRS